MHTKTMHRTSSLYAAEIGTPGVALIVADDGSIYRSEGNTLLNKPKTRSSESREWMIKLKLNMLMVKRSIGLHIHGLASLKALLQALLELVQTKATIYTPSKYKRCFPSCHRECPVLIWWFVSWPARLWRCFHIEHDPSGGCCTWCHAEARSEGIWYFHTKPCFASISFNLIQVVLTFLSPTEEQTKQCPHWWPTDEPHQKRCYVSEMLLFQSGSNMIGPTKLTWQYWTWSQCSVMDLCIYIYTHLSHISVGIYIQQEFEAPPLHTVGRMLKINKCN